MENDTMMMNGAAQGPTLSNAIVDLINTVAEMEQAYHVREQAREVLTKAEYNIESLADRIREIRYFVREETNRVTAEILREEGGQDVDAMAAMPTGPTLDETQRLRELLREMAGIRI